MSIEDSDRAQHWLLPSLTITFSFCEHIGTLSTVFQPSVVVVHRALYFPQQRSQKNLWLRNNNPALFCRTFRYQGRSHLFTFLATFTEHILGSGRSFIFYDARSVTCCGALSSWRALSSQDIILELSASDLASHRMLPP